MQFWLVLCSIQRYYIEKYSGLHHLPCAHPHFQHKSFGFWTEDYGFKRLIFCLCRRTYSYFSIYSIKLQPLENIKIKNKYERKLSIYCKWADAALLSHYFPSQHIISLPNFPLSLSVFQNRSLSIFFQILCKLT